MDGGVNFDGVAVLTRLRLTADLNAAMVELGNLEPGPSSVLPRLKLMGRIRDLLVSLGAPSPAADEVADEEQELSDDPSSPNYRYRDTGYIADSRKERALLQIRNAREAGRQLRSTDIDWDALEKNPRQAKDLIIKSNLFGRVDWSSLGESGMDPAAGFLLDRIYAAIATEPSIDSPQARRDYVIGLQSLRDRMEGCKTVNELLEVLSEIREEKRGDFLSAEQTARYEELATEFRGLVLKIREIEDGRNSLYRKIQDANAQYLQARAVVDSRTARGWTKDDDSLETMRLAGLDKSAAEWAWKQEMERTKPLLIAYQAEQQTIFTKQRAIVAEARALNQDNPLVRAWSLMGDRFDGVLRFRSHGGSKAFMSHVVNALNGKFPDWSWSEKEKLTVDRATKQEVAFHLIVADKHERRGGRPITAGSTMAVKATFGLRNVQSGNWVLNDPNSARFHVEQTAGAMSDMSDILGIAPEHLGLGGRLAMAFGARGTGGKNAARAHYEPVQRVINLTKMGGGGSLAHEYFHAVDNMLGELHQGQSTGRGTWFTTNPDVLKPGPLKAAALGLRSAILEGTRRAPETIKFSERERRLAQYNIARGVSGLGQKIREAGGPAAGIIAVDTFFGGWAEKPTKNHKQWRRLAAAFYAQPGEVFITVNSGKPGSQFLIDAAKLDEDEVGKYWSKTIELAARAFQSYTEDKLAAADRQNDYLSNGANNAGYSRSGARPYPEGEERERINAAFDRLFEAVRAEEVFEKASANKVLLDGIFGELPQEPGEPAPA